MATKKTATETITGAHGNSEITFTIKSLTPCLMHNNTGVDPLHPLTREMKKITGKRKKTDEDHELMSNIEYQQGIYHDEGVGPYWPGENIEAMVLSAAKMTRDGQKSKFGIWCKDFKAPLQYDGPRDLASLIADPRFCDRRAARVKENRVMRTRPRFDNWLLTFTLGFKAEIFDRETVIDIVKKAGEYVGLSDGRPRYGQFQVIEAK